MRFRTICITVLLTAVVTVCFSDTLDELWQRQEQIDRYNHVNKHSGEAFIKIRSQLGPNWRISALLKAAGKGALAQQLKTTLANEQFADALKTTWADDKQYMDDIKYTLEVRQATYSMIAGYQVGFSEGVTFMYRLLDPDQKRQLEEAMVDKLNTLLLEQQEQQ